MKPKIEKHSPLIVFRLKPWLIKILEQKGKDLLEGKGKFTASLVAKNYLLAHLLDLKLIPKALLPQLIEESKQDLFNDIQKTYGLTDSEIIKFKKIYENKLSPNKNARKK